MNKWNAETAEWYAEKYGEYATNKLGVEELKLEADSTVVDIGCGTGCALRHASKQVTRGSLVGIDPVPRMLEIAREQTISHTAAERIIYYEGSAEQLPIEDDFADFVLAFDSFDHWQDQAKGLKEVRRVLKINGQFVVVKDGGLPNGTAAKRKFIAALLNEGFQVAVEKLIEKDEVTFTQWLCVVKN